MLQHHFIQFTLSFLSSDHLREVQGPEFRVQSPVQGPIYLLYYALCYEFVDWVAGSLRSKQNAGLSEQQLGYLFQTKVINSAQDFTNKHTPGL